MELHLRVLLERNVTAPPPQAGMGAKCPAFSECSFNTTNMKESLALVRRGVIAGILLCATLTGCTGSEEPDFTRDQSEQQDKKEKISNMEYRSEVDHFREEAADRVSDNERRITDLYAEAADLKPTVRKAYGEKIMKLEDQNRSLKTRMDAYKANDKQDWRQFKFEFETDMDQLVESIKALGLLDKTMPL
jgi:hypothetical protein